ncbi:hypothetical protein BGZ80_003522 [Entomortierella chlamydospora]|uniref:CUE domain-containing protein n=1 Tax=Entomortierella chlamydospora TaxID=101097 RepID=A0A9P6MNJ6_9FUNG|nr:hypothetical protein BGZ79_000622 [Entomortierella chlamydospora]KAG0008379.1 hypothetical protein BGZ80_003522 [Entomortierella chlamydospora]
MSSTNNENEAHPPSDLNVVDSEESPATLSVSSPNEASSKKPPSSPHTLPTTSSQEVDSDADLEVHPAVPVSTTTESTDAAPVTSPTPVSTTPVVTPTHTPTAPASEREAKLAILTEAFPTVEKEVCEFVLESHRGDVEASINALLEISDPDFQPEPQQQAPPPAPVATPPALPRRQSENLTQGVANLNLEHSQPHGEIDPILLASTSTSEQQLRADEDFARTLAAMDEYRARDRQNVRNQQHQQQQQGEEGPSFAAEMKELMDEELPKIKERFNVAADTTKKKVTEWYNVIKSKAEAAQAQRNANQAGNSSQVRRDPIIFDNRGDEDEPLARHRVTPPLGGSATTTPPLPSRPYNLTDEGTETSTAEPYSTSTNGRRTTIEDGA